MPIKLSVHPPGSSGRTYDFELDLGEITVGRGAQCHVRLPFVFVSHHHLTIISEGSGYLLADHGSTNGTLLGHRRLPAQSFVALRHGDWIHIGELTIEVAVVPDLEQTLSLDASSELARDMVWDVLHRQGKTTDATLEVIAGPDQGQRATLSEARRFVVGSGPSCGLRLRDPRVHAEHLAFERRRDQRYWAWPLEEQLIKIGGAVLFEAQPLGHDARLLLGDTELRFLDPLLRYLDALAADDAAGASIDAPTEELMGTHQLTLNRADTHEETRPPLGPPDRPPVPGHHRLPDSAESERAPEPARRSLGAFETTALLVALAVLIGGLVAMLVLFGVF